MFENEADRLWVSLDTIFSLIRFFLHSFHLNNSEELIKKNIESSVV
jgi:hypothetical protein